MSPLMLFQVSSEGCDGAGADVCARAVNGRATQNAAMKAEVITRAKIDMTASRNETAAKNSRKSTGRQAGRSRRRIPHSRERTGRRARTNYIADVSGASGVEAPAKPGEVIMAWTVPVVVEVCLGMEVTSYASAVI